MITVTSEASSKIAQYIKESDAEKASALRISVRPGGCSGFEYKLEIDEIKEGDNTYGEDGSMVIVDEVSLPYLDGSEIRYEDSLNGSGFDINNPNAQGSCGCGESFGV